MGTGIWVFVLSTKSQKSKAILLAAADAVEASPAQPPLLIGIHVSLGRQSVRIWVYDQDLLSP